MADGALAPRARSASITPLTTASPRGLRRVRTISGWNNGLDAVQAAAYALNNRPGSSQRRLLVTYTDPANGGNGYSQTSGYTGTDGNEQLLYSCMNDNAGTGAQSVWTFSNLPAADTANGYKVYVYFAQDATGRNLAGTIGATTYYGQTTVTTTTDNPVGSVFVSDTSTTAGTYMASNYMLFTGLTSSGFTFVETTEQGNGVGISGVEIVPNAANGTGANVLPVTTRRLTVAPGRKRRPWGRDPDGDVASRYAVGSSGTIQSSGGFGLLTVSPTGGSTVFSGLIGGTGSLGNLGLVLSGSSLLNLAGETPTPAARRSPAGPCRNGRHAGLGGQRGSFGPKRPGSA